MAEDNIFEDIFEDSEEEVSDSKKSGQKTAEQAIPQKSFLSILALPLVILGVLGFIVGSNFLTSIIAYNIAHAKLKREFLEKDDIIVSKKYTGPLFRVQSQEYTLSDENCVANLQMSAFFELENMAMIPEIREKKPRIHHVIRELLTNQPVAEFNSTIGIHRARRIMLEGLNALLESGNIVEVYFTDFRIVYTPEKKA